MIERSMIVQMQMQTQVQTQMQTQMQMQMQCTCSIITLNVRMNKFIQIIIVRYSGIEFLFNN